MTTCCKISSIKGIDELLKLRISHYTLQEKEDVMVAQTLEASHKCNLIARLQRRRVLS
jgi:hypothetical protein